MNQSAPLDAAAGRRERKRQQTADHLATTAFRLFDAKGYEGVTMEEIAAAADVAKGTLYNYFPVKEALVAHQFRREIATGMTELGSALAKQATFGARMGYLLHASAEWHESRRVYLPHYLRFRWAQTRLGKERTATDEYSSGSFRILEALFREGQKSGELRSDISSKHLAATFELMLVGQVMLWLNHPELDLGRNYQIALELMLHGATVPAATSGRRRKK
jgi:AcrR family transcriptional regulator